MNETKRKFSLRLLIYQNGIAMQIEEALLFAYGSMYTTREMPAAMMWRQQL